MTFHTGKRAFHVMDKLAPVLLQDPYVKDVHLDAALLSKSTEDAMFAGLKSNEANQVRKRIYHGTTTQHVTRLRTYLRDLASEVHAEECHGLRDTQGTRAVEAWLMYRVSARERSGKQC